MESSATIKHEYLELVNKLNQSNKLKNQITDIYFYIDSSNPTHSKLVAAISSDQKIVLCEKIKTRPWAPANNTEFGELEGFLSTLLNSIIFKNDLTTLVKSHVFKLEE